MTNLHDFRDLSHLTFPWTLEEEGVAVAEGVLDIDPPAAGETAEVALPELPSPRGESWLTVRAVLAADEPWAPAGHEVAWGQLQLTPAPEPGVPGGGEAVAGGDVVSLGPGRFDAATGVLTAARRPRARRAAARRVARADRQRHRHARPGAARGGLARRWACTACATACSRSSPGRTGSWSARAPGWPARTPACSRPTRGRSTGTGSASPSTWCPKGNGPFRFPGWASGSRCPRRSTASSGSGAARGRPTATRAARRASGASPPRSTSSRRRTCGRRRTATGPR